MDDKAVSQLLTMLECRFTEPFTEIVGGPDIFIEEGVTLNLTCVVRDSPEPPQRIAWYTLTLCCSACTHCAGTATPERSPTTHHAAGCLR